MGSRGIVFDIVTMLRAGRSGDPMPGDVPLYQNVQTSFGVHVVSYSKGTVVLFLGYSDGDMKLTTDLHLAPRLRTRRAISLLPLLYIFHLLSLQQLRHFA
jgi:hypothetical protein